MSEASNRGLYRRWWSWILAVVVLVVVIFVATDGWRAKTSSPNPKVGGGGGSPTSRRTGSPPTSGFIVIPPAPSTTVAHVTTQATVPPVPIRAAHTCLATMSNPTPTDSGDETVNVSSNVPDAPITAYKNYATRTGSVSGRTNENGSASITFNIGHPIIGYTVLVVVDVGNGAVTCSTHFTPK